MTDLRQAVIDFITAFDRAGIQDTELSAALGKVREAIEVHQIDIRYKPHMWWVYHDGADSSHFHGQTPEQLVPALRTMWPEAVITIHPDMRQTADEVYHDH